jgi:hypothetical protein
LLAVALEGAVVRFSYVGPLCLLLSGCVSTPSLDKVSGVTPQTVVDVIECELYNARKAIDKKLATDKQLAQCFEGSAGRRVLKSLAARRRIAGCQSLGDYKAVAELALQVDEQLTLAPAFTHTDVVSNTFTRVFDWGLKFDSQASRTYTQTITFNISDLGKDKQGRDVNPCVRPPSRVSLNGNLGLEEVVRLAFEAIDSKDYGVDLGDTTADSPPPASAALAADAGGRGRGRGRDKAKSAFGTSIEFVLLLGVNGAGPTWTLQHFKGPGKFVSTQRTDRHSVTIGFANTAELAAYQALVTKQSTIPSTLERFLFQKGM